MVIGVPKETKAEEYRVGIIPEVAGVLSADGHRVIVERGAGEGAGFPDDRYTAAGAEIASAAAGVWAKAELIVKVKEPQTAEIPLIGDGQIVFTFFHFASNRAMTEALVARRAVCVAYELVEEDGALPILRPMSEVAGILAVQQGMKCLEKEYGGKGIILSGMAGVRRGRVVVLGGGTVGFYAARTAAGAGAAVTVLEINARRMQEMETTLPGVETLFSNRESILRAVAGADLVVGAVLTPGRRTPILLREADLKVMEKGTVLVDVAIDEGGVFETSRPTTPSAPTFVKEGIVHYCVPNIPGIVPRTSASALSYASEPYLRALARGLEKGCGECEPLRRGLALDRGAVRNEHLRRWLG